MPNLKKLADKKTSIIIFVLAAIVFSIIALRLSVGYFTIIMPIFAAFILFLIFQVED